MHFFKIPYSNSTQTTSPANRDAGEDIDGDDQERNCRLAVLHRDCCLHVHEAMLFCCNFVTWRSGSRTESWVQLSLCHYRRPLAVISFGSSSTN